MWSWRMAYSTDYIDYTEESDNWNPTLINVANAGT